MPVQKPDPLPVRQALAVLVITALLIIPVTAASIDPIGDYAIGENVTISGSTNIAVGQKVWVTVSTSDFHPTSKYESIEQMSGTTRASGTVMVTKGPGADGQNVWSTEFSTKGWEPGAYTVSAADATGGNLLWASTAFNLTTGPPTIHPKTASLSGTPSTISIPDGQSTNVSFSSAGNGDTGRSTSGQSSGDSGSYIPSLALFGLLLIGGCGYYAFKTWPRRAASTAPQISKPETERQQGEYPAVVPNLIFLSAKSEDYAAANRVYTFLTEHGYHVFFSDQTLPRMGKSDYRREIDRALEEAKHLVLVTSRKEYLESKWVEAEWGAFINEKRSGRKDGNILVLLAGPMQISDLPISLRSFETKFLDNPRTLDQILNYLS